MHDIARRRRQRRSRSRRPDTFTAAAVLAGLLAGLFVAGCGGGASAPSVAAIGSTAVSTSSPAGRTPATTSSGGAGSDALAYSRCMRASGVPDFPDPSSSGGFVFQSGGAVNPGSPLYQAAQAKCASLTPIGAGLAPGTQTHPSQAALARMLTAAQCMRSHGITDFPEPRTSVPSNIRAALGGPGVISNIDGVVLVFPATIDEQSPLFTRAAATCAFPLHNH
jgi:hypothetical protein